MEESPRPSHEVSWESEAAPADRTYSVPVDRFAEHNRDLLQYIQGWVARQENLVDDAIAHERLEHLHLGQIAVKELDCEETSPASATAKAARAAMLSTFSKLEHRLMTQKTSGQDCKQRIRHSTSSTATEADLLSHRKVRNQAKALGLTKDLRDIRDSSGRNPGAAALHRAIENAAESSLCAPLLEPIKRFEASVLFRLTSSAVIVFNVIFLAISVELRIRRIEDSDDRGLTSLQNATEGVELFLCIYYALEILVRLTAHRWLFWTGPDRSWNWLDFGLMLQAVQEQVLTAVGQGGTSPVSYIRALRLLKMLKLLRVIRLARIFRELRLVLDSIMGSVKSMMWSVVLVILITFMFSICFTQAATEYFMAHRSGENVFRLPSAAESDLKQYFGSVGTSMLSLFMASTGGVDWHQQAAPLLAMGPTYYGVFCFYIAFFLFVVMNSLTSIFVDSVREYSERDQLLQIQEQLRRKRDYISRIKGLFDSMDEDGTGAISYANFCTQLSDPKLLAFAACLDIEASDLQQFFSILSDQGRRTVDLETFVVGCIKLRGTAKSMDVMDLLISHRRGADEQHRFVRFCEGQFATIGRLFKDYAPFFDQLPQARKCEQDLDAAGESAEHNGVDECAVNCSAEHNGVDDRGVNCAECEAPKPSTSESGAFCEAAFVRPSNVVVGPTLLRL